MKMIQVPLMQKGVKHILHTLKKNILLLVIISSAGIFIFLFAILSSSVNMVTKDLLLSKMETTSSRLQNFFSPVEEVLTILQQRGKQGEFCDKKIRTLNKHFIPLIRNSKAISSMEISNQYGKEYMLMQGDSVWINRIYNTPGKPQKLVWKYENEELHLIKKEKYLNNIDPRIRPWFEGTSKIRESEIFWTRPYNFISTREPGISACKNWTDSKGIFHVIALDVLLNNISLFTSQLKISQRGKAFIFTEGKRVIGLPYDARFSNKNSIQKNMLKNIDQLGIPEVQMANTQYQQIGDKNECFPFTVNNERWWGVVDSVKIGGNNFFVCVIAPESDFTFQLQETRKIIILASLLLLLFIIIISKSYKQKKEANENLKIKSDIIEKKNKEINYSLEYAKHLQTAILPSQNMINSCFTDIFVFFKPKELVSGDFYWLERQNGDIYIAVADCTGHGIPGAMMSVSGYNSLNRSLLDFKLTSPGKILDMTTDLTIESFKKSEMDIMDGMDIALCCIKTKDGKLLYSGANNPLFRVTSIENQSDGDSIRNETHILKEYKANRQPVGNYPNRKKFTTIEIDLVKGDRYYLFSDGFRDQFGGPNGKKYKSKPFKKFLLSISQKPMNEQKRLVGNNFEYWRGNMEQIDDVCIIGFTI